MSYADPDLLYKSTAPLIESPTVQDAFKHGFKSFSARKSVDSDELREAVNRERPFKDLY